jgi:hypothetical protein
MIGRSAVLGLYKNKRGGNKGGNYLGTKFEIFMIIQSSIKNKLEKRIK